MRKAIILLILILSCLVLKAQVKDTLISKKDIATLQRNMVIIQQNIHVMHLDAIVRDKLDSVYMVNMSILTPKPEEKKKGTK